MRATWDASGAFHRTFSTKDRSRLMKTFSCNLASFPLCLVVVAVLCGRTAIAAGPAGEAPVPDVLFLIPHTHWEGGFFETREGYLKIGLPNILRALKLLKEHPNYRFVLDQACYVKPFLERYPAEEAAFRKLSMKAGWPSSAART